MQTDETSVDRSSTRSIFYFTSRDISPDFRDYDFRYPLVEAWRRQGVAAYYIRLKRRPLVSGPSHSERLIEIGLAELPRFIRGALRRTGGGLRPTYFDTTGLNFPVTMTTLKLLLPAGLWCYDLHDDYVYRASGWRKTWRAAQQQYMSRTAHVTLHAATTLRELVPGAVPLGNASDLLPLVRPVEGYRRMLVIGSIDERYDFDLLARVAQLAPDIGIDLWGQVSQHRLQPSLRLAALLRDHPNVRHFGRFEAGQLRFILAGYNVALAPYLTGIRLTRYIDPIRYYTCLNAGMELLATDIPMARPLAAALHLAHSAEDVVAICRRLARDPSTRRNRPDRYQPITWDDRARGFLVACNQAAPR